MKSYYNILIILLVIYVYIVKAADTSKDISCRPPDHICPRNSICNTKGLCINSNWNNPEDCPETKCTDIDKKCCPDFACCKYYK